MSVMLTDLIPFVPQLKETFHYWTTLDVYKRNFIKFLMKQNENTDFIVMIKALEHWDDLQNYGAPGVEMESIVCDEIILQKVIDYSHVLKKIMFDEDLVNVRNIDESE